MKICCQKKERQKEGKKERQKEGKKERKKKERKKDRKKERKKELQFFSTMKTLLAIFCINLETNINAIHY